MNFIPFYEISGAPLEIHLEEDAHPYTCHTPAQTQKKRGRLRTSTIWYIFNLVSQYSGYQETGWDT